jgi:hypothetical protein
VKQRLDALRSTLVHENTKTQLGQHVINCKFEQRRKQNARLFEEWAKDEDFPEDFKKNRLKNEFLESSIDDDDFWK